MLSFHAEKQNVLCDWVLPPPLNEGVEDNFLTISFDDPFYDGYECKIPGKCLVVRLDFSSVK